MGDCFGIWISNQLSGEQPLHNSWVQNATEEALDGARVPRERCVDSKSAGEAWEMLFIYGKERFARTNSHSLWVINGPNKQSVLFGDVWIS